jgi:DNA cross-link repair 1A protein
MLRAERQKGNTLFVFGAYSIGKERVYMAAALELGMKVYVDNARWKSMLCYDWSTAEQALLTTDISSTNLWVVPLHQVGCHTCAVVT